MEKNLQTIIDKLKEHSSPKAVEGMKRYGINPVNNLGVSMKYIRKIAAEFGKDHHLALKLWDTGIHEARIMASLVDEPGKVTEVQMEDWAQDFDSWDVCDQVCNNLFRKTGMAYNKAIEWSRSEEEFVKRAGFVLMAVLAVHDKQEKDEEFIKFLKIIQEVSTDGRN